MAKFKTPHFQILAATVNRQVNAIDDYVDNGKIDHTTAQIMRATLHLHVDELCREFNHDNALFKETLFRAQCGIEVR